MYRAIIYDLDGVIRQWDVAETRALEQRFGLPEGAIHAAAFEPALLERALTGRISDETWRLATRNVIVREHGPDAAEAVPLWSERRGRIDPEMVALVADVRGRLRTGLLTNASTRLEADLQFFQLDKAFDSVISSARVGFAKPEPRIYKVAAARLGFPPAACIAIDDTPGHVEAARATGMAGIVFTSVADLRRELGTLGVVRD